MKNDWNKPQVPTEHQHPDGPIMDAMRRIENVRPVRDREEFQLRRQDVRMSGFTLGSNLMVLGEALADPGAWKLVTPEQIGTDRYLHKYRTQMTKLSNMIDKLKLE
jgi:hypothetical protein